MRTSHLIVLGLAIVVLGGLGYGIYVIQTLTGEPPALPPPGEGPNAPQQKIASRGCNGNIQEGRLIVKTAPKYEQLTRQMRWRPPFVQVEVTVDEGGKVEQIDFIRGHPLCNDAVRKALGQWRYTPTVCNGTPVKVIFLTRFSCGDPYSGKLDPAVALVLDRLRRGGGPVDSGVDTFVKGGRAFVKVTLSGVSPQQERILTRLGFVITDRPSQPGVFIGNIALERLDLLRRSKAVSFIAPNPA